MGTLPAHSQGLTHRHFPHKMKAASIIAIAAVLAPSAYAESHVKAPTDAPAPASEAGKVVQCATAMGPGGSCGISAGMDDFDFTKFCMSDCLDVIHGESCVAFLDDLADGALKDTYNSVINKEFSDFACDCYVKIEKVCDDGHDRRKLLEETAPTDAPSVDDKAPTDKPMHDGDEPTHDGDEPSAACCEAMIANKACNTVAIPKMLDEDDAITKGRQMCMKIAESKSKNDKKKEEESSASTFSFVGALVGAMMLY